MTHLRALALSSALVAICLCSRPAAAQASVYGAATLTDYGFEDYNRSGIDFKGASGGLTGGVFYDFPIKSRLHAGIDARGSGSFGYKGGAYATAALRIAFVPARVRLRPYFELGGGVVSSRYNEYETVCSFDCGVTETQARSTNGAAILLFGLDIRVNDRFDVRAIEYGAAAGGSSSYNAGVSIADAGIVYHLPHKH